MLRFDEDFSCLIKKMLLRAGANWLAKHLENRKSTNLGKWKIVIVITIYVLVNGQWKTPIKPLPLLPTPLEKTQNAFSLLKVYNRWITKQEWPMTREKTTHTHSNKYNKQMPPAKEGGIFWRKKTMSVNRQNFVLVDIRHDHVISLLMNLKGSIWKGLRIISCKVLDLFCQHIVRLLVIHYR